MLIVYGYAHSRWYWGDLAFAIDDRTACMLWRAVWQPERVTVEQAQAAWEYATRSDNQTLMDAASLEPGDALCGESWNTIGEFLARDADAYARWYRTTPEDVAARCLKWVDWLGVWMLKPMERYELKLQPIVIRVGAGENNIGAIRQPDADIGRTAQCDPHVPSIQPPRIRLIVGQCNGFIQFQPRHVQQIRCSPRVIVQHRTGISDFAAFPIHVFE